jgi:hypothetical protein
MLLTDIKFPVALLAIFSVTSASAQIYVPPADGPVAEVILEHNVSAPMDFIIFSEAESCRGRSHVQRPTDQRRVAKIRANVPLAFSVGHSIGIKDIPCSVLFRFTPIENARYLLKYEKSYTGGLIEGGSAKCTLQVERIQSDGTLEFQQVEELDARTPFFESGAWCEAKK